jgi:hypothetical protein
MSFATIAPTGKEVRLEKPSTATDNLEPGTSAGKEKPSTATDNLEPGTSAGKEKPSTARQPGARHYLRNRCSSSAASW